MAVFRSHLMRAAPSALSPPPLACLRLLHAHGKMRSQAPKWQRLWSRRVGSGPSPGADPGLVVAHLKELTLTLSLVQCPHPAPATPSPPATSLSSPLAMLLCYALPLSFGISFYSSLCLLNSLSLSHLSRQSQWRLPLSASSSRLRLGKYNLIFILMISHNATRLSWILFALGVCASTWRCQKAAAISCCS